VFLASTQANLVDQFLLNLVSYDYTYFCQGYSVWLILRITLFKGINKSYASYVILPLRQILRELYSLYETFMINNVYKQGPFMFKKSGTD
jgi:hypothetical protein